MKLLLDTHTLLWWLYDLPRLGKNARVAIEDSSNEIWVSAVCAMEITTKFRIGKLPNAERLALHFEAEVENEKFGQLAITTRHAALAGSMRIDHKDPFDRLLIAQSQIENMPLLSNEERFDDFGVRRIW